MKDKIEYMERMRDWFQWISHLEDVNNPIRWKRGDGYYAITTMNIIYTLNGMIGKYSIGCTMEDTDRDTLNVYREFYNRNKEYRFVSRTTIDTLITTI